MPFEMRFTGRVTETNVLKYWAKARKKILKLRLATIREWMQTARTLKTQGPTKPVGDKPVTAKPSDQPPGTAVYNFSPQNQLWVSRERLNKLTRDDTVRFTKQFKLFDRKFIKQIKLITPEQGRRRVKRFTDVLTTLKLTMKRFDAMPDAVGDAKPTMLGVLRQLHKKLLKQRKIAKAQKKSTA
jgi:hypothetical protein